MKADKLLTFSHLSSPSISKHSLVLPISNEISIFSFNYTLKINWDDTTVNGPILLPKL